MSDRTAYDRARYIEKKAKADAMKPPDAISLLHLEDRAYIAGLIDGEGSIYIAAVGPNRDKTVYPLVVIAMTHLPVMTWLQESLATGKVMLHNQTNLRRHPYMKPQYRVTVFGKRAKLLCSTLLPYLRVKHEQARIIAEEFPVDARIAPGVKIERSAINEIRFSLRDRVNAINHSAMRNPVPKDRRKSFSRPALDAPPWEVTTVTDEDEWRRRTPEMRHAPSRVVKI